MLEIRTIRLGPDDNRYLWTPFEPSTDFNGRWWDAPPYMADSPWYVQARLDGEEVARIELDEHFPGSLYIGAPELGDQALEIQFIEVAERHRRRGVARKLIAELSAAHPDRRLLALSQEADDFWPALGWDCYDYFDGHHLYRPLFVQPGVS